MQFYRSFQKITKDMIYEKMMKIWKILRHSTHFYIKPSREIEIFWNSAILKARHRRMKATVVFNMAEQLTVHVRQIRLDASKID